MDRNIPFKKEGRFQTLSEAIEIDKRIKLMLDLYEVKYVKV
jgi:hypothetical protein